MQHSPIHRMYYVAIVCPADIDKNVLAFKHWMRDHFGSAAALKSPAHITLIPPFWIEENNEEAFIKTVTDFEGTAPPVTVTLNGFSHFGKKTLFVNVEENPALSALKEKVEDHFIQSWGNLIKKDERPFHPHVTIATRDVKPSDFVKAWEHFSNKEFKAAFDVNAISLLKLHPGKWSIIGRGQF